MDAQLAINQKNLKENKYPPPAEVQMEVEEDELD